LPFPFPLELFFRRWVRLLLADHHFDFPVYSARDFSLCDSKHPGLTSVRDRPAYVALFPSHPYCNRKSFPDPGAKSGFVRSNLSMLPTTSNSVIQDSLSLAMWETPFCPILFYFFSTDLHVNFFFLIIHAPQGTAFLVLHIDLVAAYCEVTLYFSSQVCFPPIRLEVPLPFRTISLRPCLRRDLFSALIKLVERLLVLRSPAGLLVVLEGFSTHPPLPLLHTVQSSFLGGVLV